MVTIAILSALVILLFHIHSTARDDGSVVVGDVAPVAVNVLTHWTSRRQRRRR